MTLCRTLRRLLPLVLIATCALSASGADLQQQLDAIAAAYHGKIALYAKNLKTGATVAINPDVVVATASVIKLPIMIEAFAEAKAGTLKLDERVPLTADNQVPGSGILTYLKAGLQPTVEDVITLMIDLSDNTATNMMIDKIGTGPVNDRLAAMGMKNTYLYKKVFKPATGPMPPDQKKFGLGKTTAREMAEVIESVDRCDLKDDSLCKRMIQILKDQQDNLAIPRYLQTDDTSEKPSGIAHKTGALNESRNDVALVYTPSGTIVISCFTWDNQDQTWTPETEAYTTIGHMAKAIVDAWAPKGVKAATDSSPKK